MQSSSQQNCTLPEVLTLQDEPKSHSQINTPQKTAKDHSDVIIIILMSLELEEETMFDDLTPEEVPIIPRYIDGFAFYKVKTDYSNWTRKT